MSGFRLYKINPRWLFWGCFWFLLSPVLSNSARAQGIVDRNHVPSLERVDPLERRRDDIDGNNIRATITNWAQTAQSGNPGDFWYEWPKNTNRRYVALTQLWVGTQTQVNSGSDIGDPVWIFDVADFRQNVQGGSTSWTFEPIGGYVNPSGREAGIAQSDEPESWPPFWPDKRDDTIDPGWRGSWNGFFGKNIFNADQEFFFKAGDDQYDRYRSVYLPDSTDASRFGLGLVIDTRIMAWSQILINDAVFLIHGVKNDGTVDLDKVGFSIWLADCVAGDCGDDVIFFELLEDVAFMTDEDGIGDQNFGTDPAGTAVIAFLETPGNAVDRIDNDGDGSTSFECFDNRGECNSPVVPEFFLSGEDPTNAIDDNFNGLIDENQTHVPFDTQIGVGYADFIDNDGDGEQGGPVVTEDMVALASADTWGRWPPNPQNDPVQTDQNGVPIVHLVGVDELDLGLAFKDNIDNDESNVNATANFPFLSEPGSPVVTQEMVDAAVGDTYRRYRVSGTDIILYDVGPEDLGKAYADGIDNDEDGAIDEGIDEGIDEMIDESRADGIDNDGDWKPLQNDTGLDGVAFNGDPGDGDGIPTTGAGTDFPGEKNIDVTDVSESDQIGITNVQLFGAGTLQLSSISDRFMYFNFLVPGDFDTEKPDPGDNDLAVSSGLFPLKAGQTERISISIGLGIGEEKALETRDNALDAYLEDYQFAQAPISPEVVGVPGNGRVTLYWDSSSEESDDEFLRSLGLPSMDFEGYRIYRATDPAFLDALIITDGRGNLTFRKPIAQFDKIDGIGGFHPVGINGIHFYLGDDRQSGNEGKDGLAHVFVDSTVTNGIRYFYAVNAYDFGSVAANISPTETPIRIRRNPDGSIETGPNVVDITPTAPVAGFVDAQLENVDQFLPRVKGSTSSRIGFGILDSRAIKPGNSYRIVFEDTLIAGTSIIPDTLTTKNFSLLDLTSGRTLLTRSTVFRPGHEFPVLDEFGEPFGFTLLFFLESFVEINSSATGWGNEDLYPISIRPYSSPGFVRGLRNPSDYRVEVAGVGEGMSIGLKVTRRTTLPARPTNVRVIRLDPDGAGGVSEVEVEYAFWDLTGPDFTSPSDTSPASFSADPVGGESDRIILFEGKAGDPDAEKKITWEFSLNFTAAFADRDDPSQGDEATIVTRKPFLASDVFEFSAVGPTVDTENARDLMDRIRVVPNPYVATNRFEGLNPFSTGRGPRVIKFINLPPQVTVRIFTVQGRLIRELRLNEGSNDSVTAADLLNGTIDWDLQTKEGLGVSYGIYLYHIKAPGFGEKSGTFAIIK